MRELTADVPKPMIKVRGKPILLHIIEGLQDAGVKNFLLVVGYREETIREYFGDGTCFGLGINYVTQVVQDGTGRVVELAREFAGNEPFILHYGDILVDRANYSRIVNLPDDVEGIVTVKANEDCSKGGAVFVNDHMEVVDVREKVAPDETAKWSARSEGAFPFYNAGIYAFRPNIFNFTAKLKPSPRGEYELTDAIREMAQFGKKARGARALRAVELTGDWADVRDPEILAQLNQL